MAYDIFSGSIRKKIMLVMMLATLPVLLAVLWSEAERREIAIESARSEAITVLRSFSEVQRRIADSTRTLLRTIAAMPEVSALNAERTAEVLGTMLAANPIYSNAILVDLQGNVVAMGKGSGDGLNFADRKQFRDAVAHGDFAFGEFVIGKATNKSIFPFGIPVLNSLGTPKGAIIVGVDLNLFADLFARSRFSEGALFGVCDWQGRRLLRVPMPDGLHLGDPISPDVFAAVKNSGSAGVFNAKGSDGMERIMVYEPLSLHAGEIPYMYMFMGLDRAVIYATADRDLKASLSVLGASVFVAMVLAWWLGTRKVVSNFNRLRDAVTRFGKGNWDAVSGVDYQDGEIGELAESFDAMASMLRRREKDLLVAKEQVERALRTKDEFLANISHEIRTPLNGVMGMLQLLMGSPLSIKQQEYLDTALQSSRGLLRVINDVLDFSKIEAGRMEIVQEPFDITELLNESVNLFTLQASRKQLSMHVRPHPGLDRWYEGDPVRIRQILFNLLGNAIKFTDEGSVTLEAYTLPLTDQKTWLFFSVSDTGVGIPDDKVDYVFDSFTQVDGSLSRRHQGTGLGLPIVSKLITLMGGSCTIDSELGVGTTVLFCIPVGIVPQAQLESMKNNTETLDADTPAPLKVLLVEDEKVNRLMTQRMLERMGHLVSCVENGKQCLEALSADSYDVILMDIQMPVMDGLEATSCIRKAPEYSCYSNISIIALSAHVALHDIEAAFVAGVDDYVTKPFDQEELSKALAVQAGRHDSGRLC